MVDLTLFYSTASAVIVFKVYGHADLDLLSTNKIIYPYFGKTSGILYSLTKVIEV